MKTRTVLLTSMLGAALLLQSGCAALLIGGGAAAGAAGYAYANGKLMSTENAPLDKVWSASEEAVKELGYSVTTQNKDALVGQMTVRTATDKKISIEMQKLSDNATELKIRVGMFGDEEISRLIMEKIKKRV